MRKERGKREGVERGRWSRGGTERERERVGERQRENTPFFPDRWRKTKMKISFSARRLNSGLQNVVTGGASSCP